MTGELLRVSDFLDPADRPERPPEGFTPAMMKAGRRALVEWYEGRRDFREGPAQIYRAMLEARDGPPAPEAIEVTARPPATAGDSPGVLTVVCWKWRPPAGYRSIFTGDHVNILAAMVARHYRRPHRVVCITDDATGIDESIGIVPLWADHAQVPSPHGRGNPSCYRRLKAFSVEARELIGERFVSLDLDCVITGDMGPVWDRPEDFVIWGDTNPTTFYNGGMFLLTAGARRQVWDRFDPVVSPRLSRQIGQFGSDQGWIGACLGPNETKWTREDGVYSYRVHLRPPRGTGRLPDDARIVFFHGQHDPWGPEAQRLDWVREHYRS